MTITEILDGLAELGRLRIEREACKWAEAKAEKLVAQDGASTTDPAQDIPQPHQAETNERR
jgi:hypothetical protein